MPYCVGYQRFIEISCWESGCFFLFSKKRKCSTSIVSLNLVYTN